MAATSAAGVTSSDVRPKAGVGTGVGGGVGLAVVVPPLPDPHALVNMKSASGRVIRNAVGFIIELVVRVRGSVPAGYRLTVARHAT